MLGSFKIPKLAELTFKAASELLSYDPATGIFIWLVDRRRSKTDDVAGYIRSDGYRCITMHGHKYFAQRIAYLLVKGVMPDGEIDHINGCPSDNRWENIRSATHAQNMRNKKMPTTNTSGVKGVNWDKATGRWRAQIRLNGKTMGLGRYADIADAKAAYELATEKFFGVFSRLESRP